MPYELPDLGKTPLRCIIIASERKVSEFWMNAGKVLMHATAEGKGQSWFQQWSR